MPGHLIDTGIISRVRVSGLSVEEWIGSSDVALSVVVAREALADLPPDDIKAIGNLALLATLPAPIGVSDEIGSLLRDLVAAYARHDPPLAANDAVIAATALLAQRTLITLNHRDFHYIEGLSWIDANGVTAKSAPLLGTRAPVKGSIRDRACCGRLRAAGGSNVNP